MSSPAGPDTLTRVRLFCVGRYNALQREQPAQARAYLAIVNHCRELELSSEHRNPDLLDWLSQPHADPDLLRACKLVFEMLGSTP